MIPYELTRIRLPPSTLLVATWSVGADVGTTGRDAADAAPTPTLFRAATLNVYLPPFVKPVITCAAAVELNVCAGQGFRAEERRHDVAGDR